MSISSPPSVLNSCPQCEVLPETQPLRWESEANAGHAGQWLGAAGTESLELGVPGGEGGGETGLCVSAQVTVRVHGLSLL